MSSDILDIRPGGIIERLHDGNVITAEQDVTAILKECHAHRDVNDKFRGFRKPEVFRHVASIPIALVEIAKNEFGMDIMNNPDDLKRFLNDSRFTAFRASTGRV